MQQGCPLTFIALKWNNNFLPCLSVVALESKLYTWVAKMIAVCVVHGGVGPHFFSERLFHQICGIPTSPALVDEVGDHTFREQLIKVSVWLKVLLAVWVLCCCDTFVIVFCVLFRSKRQKPFKRQTLPLQRQQTASALLVPWDMSPNWRRKTLSFSQLLNSMWMDGCKLP